jgi:polar amino acid transport system substrate-binding protein
MRYALHICAIATAAATVFNSSVAAETCTPAAEVPSEELITQGVLTMSTNPTLPPLQYVDNKGELKGMRVELGVEIAKRLCLKPEYIRIEFSAMVPGLQTGRWDAINTGIFFTAERAKMMQMIRYEGQAISISVGNDYSATISTTDDLAGMTIGVEVGGFEESKIRAINDDLVKKGLKALDIRTFDNFAMGFQALRAGQVEAVVSIDAVAAEYQKRGDFKHALGGLYPAPVSIAFKSHKLADAVSIVLNDMRADGSMEKLFAAYGVPLPEGPYIVEGPDR